MYDQKLTNPKDHIGSTKLPLHLVPVSATTYMALSFCEGALKYGSHNYKICGVRVSIYFSALLRHLWKWWSGEWADPKTKVPHLASAMGCIAIMLDAKLLNKLTDDRPPVSPGTVALIDEGVEIVKHLKTEFKDEKPYHYTIIDTEVHVSDPVNGDAERLANTPVPSPLTESTLVTVDCGCGAYKFARHRNDLPGSVVRAGTHHREGEPCYRV